MATSGSTDFTLTRDQIISGALRLTGELAQGESPTSTQISEASEALNIMVKAWQADGMPLWALKTQTISLTAGVNSYRIGVGQTVNTPKPLKVIQAWNRVSSSSIDIPMRIITKQEYNILGNKTSSGNPIQVYYEPLNTYGDLYVFPTPTATEAAANSIYIVYQRPFEDFDATSDTPDFPQEWFEALKYGLAVRLAGEYTIDIETRKMLQIEAKMAKDAALSFGTEEGSMYFMVDRRNW